MRETLVFLVWPFLCTRFRLIKYSSLWTTTPITFDINVDTEVDAASSRGREPLVRLYREEESYEVDFEGVNEGKLTSLWMRKAHKRNKHADTAVVKNGSLGNFFPISILRKFSFGEWAERYRDRNIEERKRQQTD